MDKRIGWSKINQLFSDISFGRNVYVQTMHFPMFAKLSREKSHDVVTFLKDVFSLSALAHAGTSVNCAGTIRTKTSEDGSKVEYFLDDGDVLVRAIEFAKTSAMSRAAGIYKVEYDPNERNWMTAPKLMGAMDTEHTWSATSKTGENTSENVQAHFAAIAGKFENKEEAGRLLIDHIRGGFGNNLRQFNPETIDKIGNHYSLLWLNPGSQSNAGSVQLLKRNIRNSVTKDARVHTLVQGEAARIFVEAVPDVKQLAAQGDKTAGALKKQQFYFSNPVNVSDRQVEDACREMGVTFAGINQNPRDYGQFSRNVWSEIKSIDVSFRSAYKGLCKLADAAYKGVKKGGKYAPQLLGGTAAVAFITDKMKDISGFASLVESTEGLNKLAPLLQSDAGKAVLASMAALVILGWSREKFNDFSSLARAIQDAGSSTFGDGSQFWYDSTKKGLARA